MLIGIRQQDQRLFHHIPIINKNQNRNRAHCTLTKRHTDFRKNLPLACTVNLCRLHHGNRNSPHVLRQKKYRKR